MHPFDKRSHQEFWPWLDRIALAWTIEIAVIIGILTLGTSGQISKQCRFDQNRIECRTAQGSVGLRLPDWLSPARPAP